MIKFIRGFVYALRGIKVAVAEQLNLKIHLLALLAVVITGVYFQIERIEWAILLLTFGLVLVAEMLNTAIEYLVNFVSPEYHRQAGKVKDVAAGAVLIAAVIAAATGILIFGEKLLNLLL